MLGRVELVGLQSGIYRGAYVLPWPPNQTPFTGALTYRVPRDGRAMPGATLAPHAWAWIVIGLTAKRGQHQWTRADIIYDDRGPHIAAKPRSQALSAGRKKRYKIPCDIPGFQEPR